MDNILNKLKYMSDSKKFLAARSMDDEIITLRIILTLDSLDSKMMFKQLLVSPYILDMFDIALDKNQQELVNKILNILENLELEDRNSVYESIMGKKPNNTK